MGAIIGQEGGLSPDAGATALIPYRPSLYFYRHSRRPLPSFPRKWESRRYCLMMVLAAPLTVITAPAGIPTVLPYDGIGGPLSTVIPAQGGIPNGAAL